MRDTASLHPQTVSNWENYRQRKPRTPNSSSAVVTVKIDPRVWKVAMKIAGGNSRRIKVIHEEEVIVIN